VDVVRKGNSVIKRISLLMVAALMAAMMMVATAAPAFAASGSQRDCEAGGGTYTKDGSTPTCVYPEVTQDGKSQNPKFQKSSQTTDTGQGNLSNKEDSNTTTTCSSPCPPGQFR
jgi:hypothetical protein